MARKMASRRFGFILGASLALVPLLLQPSAAAAASTGTLFGLDIRRPGVVSINPSSGALTPVADLSLPPGQPSPGFGVQMASDPSTHRLFLIRVVSQFTFPPTTNYQLVTVDTGTGALIVSPNLSHPLGQLVFDTSTGKLFGLTGDCCPKQIVSVDPTTGAMTHVADVTGDIFSLMTIDSASHLLYVDSLTFNSFPGPSTLLTVNPSTGVVTLTSLTKRVGGTLVFDPALKALFGITCCPFQLLRVDPVTGAETPVGNYDFGFFLEPGTALDPATHTIFVVQDVFDPMTGPIAHIASINDQTGAGVLGGSTGTNVAALAFEPVQITSDSIKADVRNALASGAISNAGLANSLLAELDAAAAARSRGQCATAAEIYQAFINELKAQSGIHVNQATANQLVGEAQFLIANCP